MITLQFSRIPPGSWRAGRAFVLRLLVAALLLVLFAACVAGGDKAAEKTPPSEEDLVKVESIDVMLLESFPVQVRALVGGTLADDCTELDDILTRLEGTTFVLTPVAARADTGSCSNEPQPFQKIVPLEAVGLTAGVYEVRIGDRSTTFELQVDNVLPEENAHVDSVTETAPAETDLFPPAAFAAQLVLAQDLAVPSDQIEIVAVTPRDWPDRCLGLAAAGEQCAATLTHGYEIILAYQARTYVYRSDTTGEIVRAEPPPEANPIPPAPPEEAATATPTAVVENCTNIAVFRRDITVPDRTRLKANVSFVKSWRLLNAGTCTWTTDYAVVFAGGDRMGGPDMVPLPKEVPPGTTVAISVPLVAPSKRGTYRGNWKLRSPSGELFGIGKKGKDPFWVVITVVRSSKAAKKVPASISGVVWHDLCAGNGEGELVPTTAPPGCVPAADGGYIANGIFEEGEPLIFGMEVSLGRGPCPSTGLATTIAEAGGRYTFDDLEPGTYCVSIDPDSAHNRPIFIPGAWSTPPGGAQTVTLNAGDRLMDVNFGWDYQFAP
ncbi:MAG: hypothetical protein D6775_09800 [Caldilineae bacterium]|nr:MAG: hypothetical protein D6775_09800 [Caldilineae bacterium]